MRRIATKEERLSIMQSQHNALLKEGFVKSEYKRLSIYIQENDKGFCMKIFKGTSTNFSLYVQYKSKERMETELERYKQMEDSHEKWVKENKENPTKSTAANCATAIRTELKNVFPRIKFSVTSDNFSMGNSVDIRWTDGPTSKEVKEFTSKYQYGHFNGMEDIYENTNSRDDIPQAKYVHENRSKSPEVAALVNDLQNLMHFDANDYHNKPDQIIYRIFCKTSIPAGAVIKGLKRNDCNCGQYEDFFDIVFETPESEKKETPNYQPIPSDPGTISVLDYSTKAIAVIGEGTKLIKDKLGKQGLNGIFQPRLSCGPGWIFPKTKLPAIKALLGIQ